MKMLWIGSYASEEMMKRMAVKSVGQASGVTSQRSLINGLDKCIAGMRIEMDTMSVQGFPCYPVYPHKVIEREEWSRNQSSSDISIGFSNTRIGRILTQKRNFQKEARKWIEKNMDQECIHIFLYEPVISRLAAVKEIKKRHPNIFCHLIVPDVPEFVGRAGNPVVAFAKQIRKRMVDRELRYVDDYIFYAKGMAEYYHVPEDKYIVMEGSIDDKDIALLEQESAAGEQIIFMYSGAITHQRAIPQFVAAFEEYDNPNVELWITGGGDYTEELKKIAAKDPRIIYHGFLETREQVLSLEAQATALLHVRDKDANASRNCFPSKIFEYMVSGKPVLSVRIEGIPEEYYSYLIEIPHLDEAGVKEALDRIVNMSEAERNALGNRAKEFILKNKSSKVQAEKILAFILKK